MGGLKLSEILLILVLVVILFGANRLPQLGSSLGSAIRNFKKGFAGEEEPEAAKAPGQIAAGTDSKAVATDIKASTKQS
jgi:sec-independent protein translocase protein TatA